MADPLKTYVGPIQRILPLQKNQVLVFGSNTQGKHGKGSAKIASDYCGAKYGQAEGLQGQSFAIITKDLTVQKHPSRTKEQIIQQIGKLYQFAISRPDLEFIVAYSGTGHNLNYYSPKDMGSMFYCAGNIPKNITFEEEFAKLVK